MQNYQQPLQPSYNAQNGYRTSMSTMQTTQSYQQPMTYSQPQINQAASYISGRYVPNEESIIPNEVPMDGNFGIFVQSDLQRIYAKTWGNDGLIHTNRYVLETSETSTNPNDQIELLNQILSRLDNIEKKTRYQPRPKTQPKQYKKQEVGKNE